MNKHYAEAIRLLTDEKKVLNYKNIVIELARRNPKLFVDIVVPAPQMFNILARETWMTIVREKIDNGLKVEAIKEIRDCAGYGLKESKDILDYAITLIDPTNYHYSGNQLDQTQAQIARLIAG